MGTGPETFVHYVQLQIFLKKKHNRPLEMSEKFSFEQKHLSVMPLIENIVWKILIDMRVRNKVKKRRP